MIYSKHPRETYTWTASTGSIYGVGKLMEKSSDTAWNLGCLLVDIEKYAHAKSHRPFEAEWIGQAIATDRIMEDDHAYDYWLSLSRLTPLPFMYKFSSTDAATIFSQEALDYAFSRAEILEVEFQPRVEGNVYFVSKWGSRKSG